ncbi:nitronate monooxygenase [Fulvivirga sp. 2943]|uniref:Nitronate monooxygenase n=1 Tax=Fulvivirga sediminis TaxID=2803949 RepID=A0A937F614_9BACT|nr:nitronate monooxygenase [Fulvivirga sediminis]MBL3657036.1 nitronate monooxygenase [Fulvivirga sediminis]
MKNFENELTRMLGIKFPIIMAPMFLVSNTEMIVEATRAGITGAIPVLNYRTDEEFREALEELKTKAEGPVGINLIVNKSNFRLKEQLKICVECKVDFIITSLGNPKEVIDTCKKHNIKVFCDVTEEVYAKKVEQLGADALIAVNSSAGGHAGKLSAGELIPLLKSVCNIPVISAGV